MSSKIEDAPNSIHLMVRLWGAQTIPDPQYAVYLQQELRREVRPVVSEDCPRCAESEQPVFGERLRIMVDPRSSNLYRGHRFGNFYSSSSYRRRIALWLNANVSCSERDSAYMYVEPLGINWTTYLKCRE